MLGGLVVAAVALAVVLLDRSGTRAPGPASSTASRPLKLYWFIPDGLRADPTVFPVFQWAEEGLLPNLKKMMDAGVHGYSVPVFPGHTPTNFATLLTGSTPRVHGIADGPMHIEGYPLKMVSKGGFSSIAKKVPPIWYTLEESGLLATVLAVPGSTPPELDLGVTLRGRWGGWGVDFPAIIFHSAADQELRQYQGLGNRVFNFGSELTKFVPAGDPAGWRLPMPESFSPPREVALANWGATVHALLYDSTDDRVENYDRALFSLDKERELARLGEGGWSDWLPLALRWETQNDYNIHTPKRMAWERSLSAVDLDTEVAINVIKLGPPDVFRIRFFYNNLNSHLVKPSHLAAEIGRAVGPMVDFPDNFPPQLIYFPEDKQTFLEETRRSLAWHKEIATYMIGRRDSDAILHDTYTPNQMLTSRWWMGSLDPMSRRHGEVDEETRAGLWREVKEMYQGIDAILGEILAHADPDTTVVFSSDHGIVPLDFEVRLNNLFARKGWLFDRINADTGEYEIDWDRTRVIYLTMDNVYINPDGLGGNYHRAKGPAYEKLRREVIEALSELHDEHGVNPVAKIVPWERAEAELALPADRIGDLVIANRPTYGWEEEVSADRKVFHPALKSGYKQAILPSEVEGMLTPFAIMGPGVRAGHRMGQPIRHIDQYPTIMELLGLPIPAFVEGKPIAEVRKGR